MTKDYREIPVAKALDDLDKQLKHLGMLLDQSTKRQEQARREPNWLDVTKETIRIIKWSKPVRKVINTNKHLKKAIIKKLRQD